MSTKLHLDHWQRLDRFLVLGCDHSTFYVDFQFAIDDSGVVEHCLASDGLRTIDRIVDISTTGRAPKNDPAIFSLAMAAKLGDEATRRAAYAALPRVCRIAPHLMLFAEFAQGFGGWGRGMRKAVGAWFNSKRADELALQLATYQSRDGWSNRDLLRLAHPRAVTPSHDRLFAWAVRGELPANDPATAVIAAIEQLRRTDELAVAVALVHEHRIPRECVPAEWLKHPEVWEALLPTMPLATLIDNLAVMTRVGLFGTGSTALDLVVTQLASRERLVADRVHPLTVLAALMTYKSGRGVRSAGCWIPAAQVVDVLDAAFYASFGAVEPAGKRMLIALDVSGSMASGDASGLTPQVASAAMALVTAATERDHTVVAFTAAGLVPLAIGRELGEVVALLGKLAMGETDCALPMIWAKQNRIDVDTFVVYTDNETGTGSVHPTEALRDYRDARGIPAKLVVVGMTSPGFSVADPIDAGMLDVVGFDASAPPVIADFARA